MPKRLFIRDNGLDKPVEQGYTAIGSINGVPKKKISTTISDIVDNPTTLSVIHIPFSEDNPHSYMGFPRGAKLRTNVYTYTQMNKGPFYPSLPPGYEPGNVTMGFVYGESSIKTLSQRPRVINGFEQKVNTKIWSQKVDFIKSLIENSEEKDIQMEYLYHEGQSVINTKPIVHFDGTYITVDARETDILEDTYLWYVIRGVAGTTIDISIQIFVCNCELNWPNDRQESFISRIFNGDSAKRLVFKDENVELIKNIDYLLTRLSQEQKNCNVINYFYQAIEVSRTNLMDKFNQWEEFDKTLIEESIDPETPNTYANTFTLLRNELTTFSDNLFSELQVLHSEFTAFECMIKNNTGWVTTCDISFNSGYWLHGDSSFISNDVDFYITNSLPDAVLSSQISLDNDSFNNRQAIKKLKDFYFTKRKEYIDSIVKKGIKYNTILKIIAVTGNSTNPGYFQYANEFNIGVLVNYYGC